MGMDDYLAANKALCDEWTAIHETSSFYDLEGFKAGGSRLRDYEVGEVGDVTGKSLLHLQCHFGIDGPWLPSCALTSALSARTCTTYRQSSTGSSMWCTPRVVCSGGCLTWSAGLGSWPTSCARAGSFM